jgi:hypothetical protein
MVGRLKTAYKTELEALKGGQAFDGGDTTTPKKRAPKAKAAETGEGIPKTPKRKSKAVAAGGDDEGVTPKKKAKKAKVEDEETAVKEEIDETDVL